jgi:hypothetical protein
MVTMEANIQIRIKTKGKRARSAIITMTMEARVAKVAWVLQITSEESNWGRVRPTTNKRKR